MHTERGRGWTLEPAKSGSVCPARACLLIRTLLTLATTEENPTTYFSITYLSPSLREDLTGGVMIASLSSRIGESTHGTGMPLAFIQEFPGNHPELQTRAGTLPSRRP